MMLTRELFYAITFVAQVKACKRFDYDEDLLCNALDTLQQARKFGIASREEEQKAIQMMSDYLFNTRILF